MKNPRDPDALISAYLEDGITELPDRSYDVVRSTIDHTRQRFAFGPWKEEHMTRFATFAVAAAAVLVIALVGLRFLPSIAGVGASPSPSPSPSPSANAVKPIPDPDGFLLANRPYAAHPFKPDNGMTFTFIPPSGNWQSVLNDKTLAMLGMVWASTDGLGLGFLRVTSLNGDPCHWNGTTDDVAIGPSVDDLANALVSAGADYAAAAPVSVRVGGYDAKLVTVTLLGADRPAGTSTSDCDEGVYRIWNGDGFNIYAQGPSNRWDLYIVNVDGQRVVILASSLPTNSANEVTELPQIVDGISIDP